MNGTGRLCGLMSAATGKAYLKTRCTRKLTKAINRRFHSMNCPNFLLQEQC